MEDETGEHSSIHVRRPKLLSVVVTDSNEDYVGNFKYRLTTCINYIARNLKDLGRLDDLEILVTDWNSGVPLSKVLALSPEAKQIWDFPFSLKIGKLGIYIRFRQRCIAPKEATTENICPTKEK